MDSHDTDALLESQSRPPPRGTTFLRTCFNGINALSGIGMLSVPYALSEGGWLSLILLFLVAITCCYTAQLIRQCMDEGTHIQTYADVGGQAFGAMGRTLVSSIMYFEIFLVAVEILILEGDNLDKLFPDAGFHIGGHKIGGKRWFFLLAALAVLPTVWLSLNLLAYLSAGGVLASVILVGSVAWAGAADGVGFHEKGVLWKWNGLPTAISLYVFCYGGHPVLPTLRNSMRERSQFPQVLYVSYILSTISYASMAVLGYLMYGQNLKSQVTLNLPVHNLSSKIAIYTTLINPITKYAIIVSPIATDLEETFSLQNSRLISLLLRTGLVISTLVVALTIPFFTNIMTFIGSLLNVSVCFLFPCLCYLKIYRVYRSFGAELMLIGAIIVMGTFVAVIGTYTSVRQIVEHLHGV